MEKKDLYLSDEEIIRAELKAGWKEIPHYRDEEWGDYYHDAKRAISKASADYAVKKVVEWVNVEVFGNADGYIVDDEPKTLDHSRWTAQQKKWQELDKTD